MDNSEIASRYDEAIFAMVLNRLMDPSSKYRIFRQWVESVYAEGLSDIQLHHYYRALDFLADQKEAIERELYGQLTDLLSLDLDLVFYDTTSSYFEGEETDDLAQYGYSKDSRGDRKQVVIGLLMTRQGIPVAHQVFPGNLHDSKSFAMVIDDLKKRFSVNKVILVGDRVMVNEANLAHIRELGMEYVVGVKLRKSNHAQELLSIRGRFKKVRKNLEVKSKEIGGETYVLCYNPEAAARIDERKVEEESKYDGKYGIRTNSKLTPEEAALVYKELWRVEQAFRNLKTDLDLRPMYHRRESRICGHILVCFLALVMESYLALKLREFGCETSVKNVLHDISQMKASLILVNGLEQIVRTELYGQANVAFAAIGTQAPARILQEIWQSEV